MGFVSQIRISFKRFTMGAVLASLLIPGLATSSHATIFSDGNYYYSLDNNGNATLESVANFELFNANSITIPDLVDGHPVIILRSNLFETCSAQSVSFPRTLVKIMSSAFYHCELTEVIFPPNMETLGSSAFSLNSIQSIIFTGNPPTNVDNTVFEFQRNAQPSVYVLDQFADIGNPWHGFPVTWISPFRFEVNPNNTNEISITGYYGTAPSSLSIPSTLNGKQVVAISANAFKDVPLNAVTLPEGLTSIGENAFLGTGLTSIVLPTSLQSIGGSAFSGSLNVPNNLSTIEIPSAVTTIGDYAFALNPTLNTVNLLGDSPSSLGVSLFFFSGQAANVHANVFTDAIGYTHHFDAYPITRVARPVLSNDATLSALATDPANTLSPTFPALSLRYAVTVGNSITSIRIRPTASESHATITVNGSVVSSGSLSGSISLAVGDNPINIVTLAQDRSTTFTYVLTVTRLGADLSNIATLRSIEFPAVGTYGPTVTPNFAASTTSYATTVPFSIKTFKIKPTVTDTGKATVSINGVSLRAGATSEVSLLQGDNAISIVVTAQDQSTKTYTVNVHQNGVSTDATLTNLQVTGGSLVETFSPSRMSYTLTNMSSTNSDFFFKPYLTFRYATVKVDGQETLNERSNPTAISIPVGTNKTVNVVVTAEDGISKKTYAINIVRATTVAPKVTKAIAMSKPAIIGYSIGIVAPTFSGSAIVSTTTQWYRCNSASSSATKLPAGCVAIPGAKNNSYTVTKSDRGKFVLVARTVSNRAGSVTTVSATGGRVL